MNFEVFDTEAEAADRHLQLSLEGALVEQSFDGHVWVIKWKMP